MSTDDFAHDDQGDLVPTEGFDFAEVDRNVFGAEGEDGSMLGADGEVFSERELDAALKVFSRLVRWVWQNGMNNPDGLKIRAILICWIFTKELRSLTLTDMARGFGMKKQSLGRWHDDFKKVFPQIKTPHMRP